MDEKPDRHRVAPPEAKRLSYERDCVNTYGESDKASRKAIPLFKARSNRTMRRGVVAALRSLPEQDVDLDRAETRVAEATFHGLHPAKRKEPDTPLGIALARRDKRRERELKSKA